MTETKPLDIVFHNKSRESECLITEGMQALNRTKEVMNPFILYGEDLEQALDTAEEDVSSPRFDK